VKECAAPDLQPEAAAAPAADDCEEEDTYCEEEDTYCEEPLSCEPCVEVPGRIKSSSWV